MSSFANGSSTTHLFPEHAYEIPLQPLDKSQPFLARSVQVADYLEQQILSGLWLDRLPGERTMANYVSVGRETIRSALKVLEQRGWSFERTPTGTKATPPSKPVASSEKTVGLLLPMLSHWTSHRTLLWLDELRKFLYHKRIRLHVYDGYYKKTRLKESLVDKIAHHAWIIAYPNAEAQQWCIRTGIRGVVLGHISKEVPLPSVDIHYRAVHRHAVTRMIHSGHRKLLLLMHNRQWESDTESQLGFHDGIQSSRIKKVQGRVELHDGTPNGIRKTVERILASPSVPTAWSINVVPHFLTVMMHLLSLGVRIPQDISLISPDAEPWQFFTSPEPTRYIADVSLLAKKTGLMVQNLINGAPLTNERQHVIPVFSKGNTLIHPAESRFL